MMKKVLQLLLSTSIFSFMSLSVYGQESPAIGDIRLQLYQNSPPYYEVLIYYTDGIAPPDWGGICADVSSATVGVLCRQLGFQASGTPLSGDTGRSVWLKGVQCTGDETHILQCGHQAVTGSERNGAMSCDGRGLRQLIQCSPLQRPTPYNGEIRLCPADSTLNSPNNVNITSVSFGVVALNIGDLWRGIVQLSGGSGGLLSSSEANAICRQLGFTDAVVGSAVARSATSYSSNFDANCYSSPGSQGYIIQSHAWMTTEDVTCNSPQNCLGCCYSTIPEAGCPNCDARQDIVIRCTFDINKSKKITGTQDKCNLNSKQCLPAESLCSREKKALQDVGGALGFFFALVLLINIIIVAVIIYKRYCSYD